MHADEEDESDDNAAADVDLLHRHPGSLASAHFHDGSDPSQKSMFLPDLQMQRMQVDQLGIPTTS
jgi:hypothetical protein